MTSRTVFLKLGGSLITEKSRERTERIDTVRRLCREIAAALGKQRDLRLLLGHGSGSFGHHEAARHRTTEGVRTVEEWTGFTEVWRAADALNRIVMDQLSEAGVTAMRFSPSGFAFREEGSLRVNAEPMQAAMAAGLVPVVYGDVVFDRQRGGGIASTEDVFAALQDPLQPQEILLAGLEVGVYRDFPARNELLRTIHPGDERHGALAGSAQVDVTGGMRSKVEGMLRLVEHPSHPRVLIFSGEVDGRVEAALGGDAVEGTWLEKA